jgi:hypothetical protein
MTTIHNKEGRGKMKKSVRIEDNGDGTYSAWIFSVCYLRKGSNEECKRVLRMNGEEV